MTNNPSLRSAVALVTGANKGIGYEVARGLGRAGAAVLLGCRDRERGREAQRRLREEEIDAHSMHLDVTDLDTIRSAASEISAKFGHLDILVNNAGINAEAWAKPSVVDFSAVRKVYDVNVFGAIAVIQAMLPLLRLSARGRIVNVSSSLGSLHGMNDFEQQAKRPLLLGYSSSKAALSAITLQFANELRETGIKVNAVCPGLCDTDLSGHRGRPASEGAAVAIRLASLPHDGPTGGFFDDHGVVQW